MRKLPMGPRKTQEWVPHDLELWWHEIIIMGDTNMNPLRDFRNCTRKILTVWIQSPYVFQLGHQRYDQPGP